DARLGADVRGRAQLDRRRLDRRLQLDQGDVVGAVVVRVNGDLGRLRLFTAGGAVEAADPQLHLRRAGAVHTVRGGQHPVGGDQRTTAEVLALLLQRNDERVLLGRVVAADDVRLDFVRVVGGVGQGTGCRRTTDSRRRCRQESHHQRTFTHVLFSPSVVAGVRRRKPLVTEGRCGYRTCDTRESRNRVNNSRSVA